MAKSAAQFQESQRIQLAKEGAIHVLITETEFAPGDLVKVKGEQGKFKVAHAQKSSKDEVSVIVVEPGTRAFRAFRPERISKVKGGELEMPKTKASTRKATTTKRKPSQCLCGCGGLTGGGRFLPGHDAKLKSALVNDARSGKDAAVAKLKEMGWERFIPSANSKPNGRKAKATRSSKKTTSRRKAKV